MTQGLLRKKTVPPDQSFCLEILANDVIGYLASLHPDHGIPVYQEMEYLAFTGTPLGDLIKHTHDGVILASGAKRLDYPELLDGMQNPARTPSDIMLMGTAARVLFGDPSLCVANPFTAPPFDVAVTRIDESTLGVKATLQNVQLKSTFTDTYYADLASNPRLFNDTARFALQLPEGWDAVSQVTVRAVSTGTGEIRHRLVGFGVEKYHQWAWLHVQIDVPTSGYMQSAFRAPGSTVELEVRR